MKKVILGVSAIAVMGFGSVFFADSVQANTVDSLQDKQTEIASERSSIKADLSKADTKIADVLFELQDLNEEVTRINEALKENEGLMSDTKTEIKSSKGEMEVLEEEIVVLEAKIEERFDILKSRISSYQQNGGNVNYLDVFFGSKDFNEFISRISYVTTITNSDSELMQEQEDDKALVEETQNEVEEKLNEQLELKAELEEIGSIIKEQKEEKEAGKKELKNKEAKLVALKSDLNSKDSNLASLEASVRSEISGLQNPTAASSSNRTVASGNGSGAAGNSNKGNKAKAPRPSVSGGAVTTVGNQFIGRSSYVYGAADPKNGRFDCSGFVNWAYGQSGVSVPRTTGALANTGTAVSASNMQPGDLVFFNTNGRNGHVGIYIGGGNFIGSQSSTGVAIQSLSSGYWKGQFSGTVRRVN